MDNFNSKSVEELAQDLVDYIIEDAEDSEEGLTGNELLSHCRDVLEDGNFLGTYFADVIPQRNDYDTRDDYEEAREEFERSDSGLRIQQIVEEAYYIVEEKQDDLAA